MSQSEGISNSSPATVELNKLGFWEKEQLPLGTMISDVGCQFKLREQSVMYDKDFYLTDEVCGKTPTVKSEYTSLLCQDHLVQSRKEYDAYQKQKRFKRLVVVVNSKAFNIPQDAMFIAIQVDESKRNHPRFRGGSFGRTWDHLGSTAEGEGILADTTWGHWGYFRRGGVLYKIDMSPKFNIQPTEMQFARVNKKNAKILSGEVSN